MQTFRTWAISSLPRFLVGSGLLFTTPLLIGFLVISDSDLTLRFALLLTGLSVAAGIVWSLLMWFTVVLPLRKKFLPSGIEDRRP